jgi:hypothetical protein
LRWHAVRGQEHQSDHQGSCAAPIAFVLPLRSSNLLRALWGARAHALQSRWAANAELGVARVLAMRRPCLPTSSSSGDVEPPWWFYADAFGGEAVMEGERSIVALARLGDHPGRRPIEDGAMVTLEMPRDRSGCRAC